LIGVPIRDLTSSPFIAYIASDSLLLHSKVKKYAEWFIKSLSNPIKKAQGNPDLHESVVDAFISL
jgi:hypothetical protein